MQMNCTDTIPYGRDFLSNLSATSLGLIISAGLLTLLSHVVSLITIVQVTQNVQQATERFMTWWLVGICPVISLTSFTGILFPRSSHIDELVSAIYVSISIGVFLKLMLLYHGGEDAFCKNLEGVKIPRPCCCCVCLGNTPFTRQIFRRIKISVYQILVVRPVLLYCLAVVQSEEKVSNASMIGSPARLVVSLMNATSTGVAFVGLFSAFRLSTGLLKAHGIVLKFVYIKIILFLCDPQGLVLGILVSSGVLPCSGLFYHAARAETLKFIVLCFEMLLVSVLGYWQFGKKIPVYVLDKEINSVGYNSMDQETSHDI